MILLRKRGAVKCTVVVRDTSGAQKRRVTGELRSRRMQWRLSGRL